MVKLEMVGFDEFEKEINQVNEVANELFENDIDLNDLFSKSFMKEHTAFSSLDEFMINGGFHKNDNGQYHIDDEVDVYVSENTAFDSFESLMKCAYECYIETLFSDDE
ncbi:MAG: hypothetical protein A2Y17_06025 [Clostridiales bacterium GWF2_38_85]|nr:MAG: hypothetical protein A2Y17_06025 [Clostridiales bacterium GWF2_38_85]